MSQTARRTLNNATSGLFIEFWTLAVGADVDLDQGGSYPRTVVPLADGTLVMIDQWGQSRSFTVKALDPLPVSPRSLVAAGSTAFPIHVFY